jgi:glycosyltransferase involved in cell wall biosynthesis
LARGENLLLLNNDAQLMPGSISSALRTLHSSNDIGAVGGKIILADGTLQEAGSIIWQDGSCLGFGRGDSPLAPPYMYQRDVDYCSAAFLLTPRELFLSAGGFDEAFAPAYYEEVDYCVGLWEQGKRVVYDPNSIIVHYEFGSSTSQSSAIDLQIANRETFVKKRGDWLRSQHAAPSDPLLAAHRLRVNRRRILFLDDRVPHTFLGAGFPRSNRMLSELSNLGCAVTFYPTTCPREQWEDVYRDTSPEVEVMLDHGGEKLKEFLRQRRDYYDAILISRPHNMAMFKEAVGDEPGLLNGARVIYDAEALFAYREIRKSAVAGQPLSEIEQENLIAEEVRLAENCDYVVSVSDRERDEFARHGCEHAFTLGHTVEVTPTEKKFEARQDLLFVGAIHSLSSPNADSMIWFVHEILPLIQQRLGDIKLTIAGLSCADFQRRVRSGSVELVGKVDDLSPLYDRARVFVAPTRFSAGIPIKICDAAAHGLPTVTTNLSGYQLGWSDERELLLADDPESFADACVKLYNDPLLWSRLRENAIERVGQDFSPKTFLEQLRQILP